MAAQKTAADGVCGFVIAEQTVLAKTVRRGSATDPPWIQEATALLRRQYYVASTFDDASSVFSSTVEAPRRHRRLSNRTFN